MCQIKIYPSLSQHYENDQSQKRWAYNDFLYYSNERDQNIMSNQCPIIFIVCKEQIVDIASNLLCHANDQIMGIAN